MLKNVRKGEEVEKKLNIYMERVKKYFSLEEMQND
jgi:hypothetical protein